MSVTTPARPRAGLLLLAYLAFVSLGLPDGLLGVGWPSIRTTFALPTETVGLLITVGTVGYLTSSVLAGFSLARLGVGRLLAVSTLLASLALTGYATSPGIALMTGCALVLGLGSGAVDAGLNAYAAGAFGPRHMNWMHACFGLGVAIGPLIMTAVIGAGLGWRWGYGLVAAAQLALAAAFALTVRAWLARTPAPAGPGGQVGDSPAPGLATPATPVPTHGPAATSAPTAADGPAGSDGPAATGVVTAAPAPATVSAPVRVRDTLRLPAVWLGGLAFAVYVAIEVSTGLWAFLLLTEGRGLAPATAGLCVSGYWGSLFVGRVVQGVVAERLGTAQVLRASLVGMAAGALLVALPGPGWLTAAGLFVVGFAAAPVFPLLTLTTAERVGAAHADRTIGLQIGAAGIGAALIPSGLGVLFSHTSVTLLGPAMTGLAVLLLLLHLLAGRPPTRPATG
ncbi:MFS transporter [Micromonospora sp. PLK6-60]|uniref:MFS transporter n=1 Tax=Micromonospora sp. PLK6-60 TaxID=2873383 RepID=UPI001CA790C4|nr:MFS transporter [Micromonospora sp. PLK6-60]MBY8875752.1 MFS transporter [Micromonospora sp. PLK6-60]